MSVYALIDPRTKRTRYVGRSGKPQSRLRQHLRWAHTPILRNWIAELRTEGMMPEFRLLDGGTEREWILRLSPDLNVNPGLDGEGLAALRTHLKIRVQPRELKMFQAAAATEGDSLSNWIRRILNAAAVAAKKKGAKS
jgi:hypothetical protein